MLKSWQHITERAARNCREAEAANEQLEQEKAELPRGLKGPSKLCPWLCPAASWVAQKNKLWGTPPASPDPRKGKWPAKGSGGVQRRTGGSRPPSQLMEQPRKTVTVPCSHVPSPEALTQEPGLAQEAYGIKEQRGRKKAGNEMFFLDSSSDLCGAGEER